MQRILILEDVAETRTWLAGVVRRCFAGARVTEAATLSEARGALRHARFDLALIDLSLPDGDGTTILRELSAATPDTLAIVTTVMASDEAVVGALAAGASGYLLKSDPEPAMERHLRLLSDGVPALSPSIARRIMEHFRKAADTVQPDVALTARESETLSMIARGLRVAEVAQAMGIADSTVTTHVKAIYRKLGISTRAEAATEAARRGLL